MMSDNRVADMTVDELRTLIRESVTEAFVGFLESIDPDEGLELRPEMAEYLRTALEEKRRGTPLAEVKRELGLDTSDA
jgi:hypothetical protein